MSHRSLDCVESIGIDEVQWNLGHKYQTLVYQIDEGCKRLLWIGPDRTAKTLFRFFRFLGKQRSAKLQFVCSDMWQAYLKVIAKKVPYAHHVLDRFHGMQKMTGTHRRWVGDRQGACRGGEENKGGWLRAIAHGEPLVADILCDGFGREENPVRQHFAKLMTSFRPGLFAGGDAADLPRDNLDLERWFHQPKRHERRIHGRRHAGVRIVQERPTLALTLDAHEHPPRPFNESEIRPYRDAVSPSCQRDAIHRRKVMSKARSKKFRRFLLAELKARCLGSS